MIFSQALFFSHLEPIFSYWFWSYAHWDIWDWKLYLYLYFAKCTRQGSSPSLIAKITPCVWNVLYNTNILPRLTTWTLRLASDFVDFFLSTNSHFFSESGHVCMSYVLAFNSSIVNQFLSATKECLLFFVWPKTKTFLAGLLLDFSGTFPGSLFLCEHNLQFSREI